MSKIELINDYFKLPISYNSSKVKLNETIITDLELIKTIDEGKVDDQVNSQVDSQKCDFECSSDCSKHPESKSNLETKQNCDGSMFNYAFNPQSVFGKKVLEQFPQYYTTDKEFLKDSQVLLKTYKTSLEKPDYSNILSIWNELKLDKSFIDKYQYIDIDYFKNVNDFFGHETGDLFLKMVPMNGIELSTFSLRISIFSVL